MSFSYNIQIKLCRSKKHFIDKTLTVYNLSSDIPEPQYQRIAQVSVLSFQWFNISQHHTVLANSRELIIYILLIL